MLAFANGGAGAIAHAQAGGGDLAAPGGGGGVRRGGAKDGHTNRPAHGDQDVTFFASGASFGASAVVGGGGGSQAKKGGASSSTASPAASWTSRHKQHQRRVAARLMNLVGAGGSAAHGADGAGADGGHVSSFAPCVADDGSGATETAAAASARESAYHMAWRTIHDGGERVLHALNTRALKEVAAFVSASSPSKPRLGGNGGAAGPEQPSFVIGSGLLPVVMLFAGVVMRVPLPPPPVCCAHARSSSPPPVPVPQG